MRMCHLIRAVVCVTAIVIMSSCSSKPKSNNDTNAAVSIHSFVRIVSSPEDRWADQIENPDLVVIRYDPRTYHLDGKMAVDVTSKEIASDRESSKNEGWVYIEHTKYAIWGRQCYSLGLLGKACVEMAGRDDESFLAVLRREKEDGQDPFVTRYAAEDICLEKVQDPSGAKCLYLDVMLGGTKDNPKNSLLVYVGVIQRVNGYYEATSADNELLEHVKDVCRSLGSRLNYFEVLPAKPDSVSSFPVLAEYDQWSNGARMLRTPVGKLVGMGFDGWNALSQWDGMSMFAEGPFVAADIGPMAWSVRVPLSDGGYGIQVVMPDKIVVRKGVTSSMPADKADDLSPSQ